MRRRAAGDPPSSARMPRAGPVVAVGAFPRLAARRLEGGTSGLIDQRT
jgi:hypothetical protein